MVGSAIDDAIRRVDHIAHGAAAVEEVVHEIVGHWIEDPVRRVVNVVPGLLVQRAFLPSLRYPWWSE